MAAPKKTAAAAESTESAFQAALEPISSLQENVRLSTEKGIQQIRAQYEAVKEAAEKTTGKIEESVTAAQAGAKAFNMKALDLVRANTNATFDHMQALFAAKTVSDFVGLQSEFMKAQMETYAAQARELAELGNKVVTEAVEPVKSTVVVPFKK